MFANRIAVNKKKENIIGKKWHTYIFSGRQVVGHMKKVGKNRIFCEKVGTFSTKK